MKKKFYIQPNTNLLSVSPASNIALTSSFIDNNSTDGMEGAPLRNFSGDSQGLKYLI